jgi:hypothetical protein
VVTATHASSNDVADLEVIFIFLHLLTTYQAPYAHRIRIPNAPSLYELPDPPGYKPVFFYLLARHGSRWSVPVS